MIGFLRSWFTQPAPVDARTQRMIERQQRHGTKRAESHKRYAERRARELRQARERFEASLCK